MKALFGEGRHPDADRIEAELIAQGHSAAGGDVDDQARPGLPDHRGQHGVAAPAGRAYTEHNTARSVKWDAADPGGRPGRDPHRGRAEPIFAETYGRAPLDKRELSGFVAEQSRRTSTGGGRISTAHSPRSRASARCGRSRRPRSVTRSGQAHEAAVDRSLTWLQEHAAYTRVGAGGVAQVETRGLLVAVFTHRDSRNGDPQLHTHAAVSNKVQTLDGRWLALDGRVIHELAVAASEFYNTAMEEEFTARLGGEFVETVSGSGRRPIRELRGSRSAADGAVLHPPRGAGRAPRAAGRRVPHRARPAADAAGDDRPGQRANLETRVSKARTALGARPAPAVAVPGRPRPSA